MSVLISLELELCHSIVFNELDYFLPCFDYSNFCLYSRQQLECRAASLEQLGRYALLAVVVVVV